MTWIGKDGEEVVAGVGLGWGRGAWVDSPLLLFDNWESDIGI